MDTKNAQEIKEQNILVQKQKVHEKQQHIKGKQKNGHLQEKYQEVADEQYQVMQI